MSIYQASRSEELKSESWYYSTITSTNITPAMRLLLEERGIPSSEVEKHLRSIRDQAWVLYPYPCVGMFYFARLPMLDHPLYTTILKKLKPSNESSAVGETKTKLLDLGCGFAQDLRQLVHDGVDSRQLTGLDNHDGFFNLGYELFRDRETFKSHFVIGDMLDLKSMPVAWRSQDNKFDVIWGGASFHLFSLQDQVKAYKVAVECLKNRPGSGIYGYQTGHRRSTTVQNMYLHSPETFVTCGHVLQKILPQGGK